MGLAKPEVFKKHKF